MQERQSVQYSVDTWLTLISRRPTIMANTLLHSFSFLAFLPHPVRCSTWRFCRRCASSQLLRNKGRFALALNIPNDEFLVSNGISFATT